MMGSHLAILLSHASSQSFPAATMLLLRSLLVLSLCCLADSKITSHEFLVEGLAEIDPVFDTFDGEMHAGLVSITPDITEDEGKLMFWLFEPTRPLVDDSLVIWFNGGPGCSSFHAGLFLEMGPVTTPLQPAGSFGQSSREPRVFNEYAWTNVTAVMYVEQPVGTGFSYGAEPPTDEEGVSTDFYHFMLNFYEIFPQHASKRLYLVGESYAGYYVPSMAHKIYNMNKKAAKDKIVNLQGIALGNGWADVDNQGPAVIDYAYWHGMIDSITRDAFHKEWEHCKQRTGEEPPPFHPLTTPDECGMMETVLKAAGAGLFDNMSPNTYDVTTWDKYFLLTDPVNTNTVFFNDPRVREKLHVPKEVDKDWAGCMPGAGRRRRRLKKDEELLPGQVLLKDDQPISMVPYIAELLDEAEIQVLIYNGDRDLSTCAQGSERMLNGMEWSGHDDWLDLNSYKRALWMVDGYPAGWSKSVKNLDFLIVYNSGHLVPYNVPKQAFDLVTRLVKNKPFGDVTIPVVFDPSVLPQEKKMLSSGSGGRLLPAFFGFLAGGAAVVAYLRFKEKWHQKSSYEVVGDVETEAIS